MKPTIKQLLVRIEQLEAEVARLKAQPQSRHEYHYHYQQPAYQPMPAYPLGPWWTGQPTWVASPNIGAGTSNLVGHQGIASAVDARLSYGPDH